MSGRSPFALRLYLAATAHADPVVRMVLRRRLAEGKEHPERLPERLGAAGRPRPPGALLWMHAASIGESLALLPLIERLATARPSLTTLVTTGTTTSARLMAERLPKTALHQFSPVDTRRAVTAFLDHWRPNVAVWAESEFWPRMLIETRAREIPMILMNARMARRSVERWRRVRASAADLLGRFDLALAQDAPSGEALLSLGMPPERLRVTGSLKSSARPPDCDSRELARLRATIGDRFVWLAASTHEGEEDIAAEAHRRVRRDVPDALLIVAPRHPARAERVAADLARHESVARRSAGDRIGVATSVYLADTLGEMGLWYRLAPVSFVGGSTGGIGGHNPYEPVALGSAVIHGPDVGNFTEAYRELDASDGARLAADPDSLAAAVLALTEPRSRLELANRARPALRRGPDALAIAEAAVLARLP